ncbi:hydrolase [Nocardioides panacis]|uniref:Hydrolase n=1 Tax=Nocardioides panacis TaxID=2849501 RepID=A0A975Y0W5_9ACTN|nr:alpha/beta family hydrolase [Nocardioides panacis]QWZ08903.1 hydrolase [Nocardioides panacis]
MTDVSIVATPHGDARLHRDRSRHPVATLLLGHGAGGGVESADLAALAAALPRNGISVVRVEQPWRVAGKKIAPRPAVLDECFVAAADKLRVRTPLVVGGRSAGARSAARTARELGASGFVALAFPLHPPGRPERSRLDELQAVRVPALVVQGERDAFGRPEEFPSDLELTVVPGADHGFKVPRRGPVTDEEAMAIIVEAVLEFVVRDVVGAAGNQIPR